MTRIAAALHCSAGCRSSIIVGYRLTVHTKIQYIDYVELLLLMLWHLVSLVRKSRAAGLLKHHVKSIVCKTLQHCFHESSFIHHGRHVDSVGVGIRNLLSAKRLCSAQIYISPLQMPCAYAASQGTLPQPHILRPLFLQISPVFRTFRLR